MADRAKIINIHSSVEGKFPEATQLEYGELAVNYNSKTPKLSFKVKDVDNDVDNFKVTTISDDNYFIKIIEENEEVTANALINLNNSIKDIEEQVAGARYFTEEKEKTIAAAISEVGEVITHITYDKLVKLRNNGELIPGKQYRIIDYSTYAFQEYTESAGHDFDIILMADDENTLNENARAIQREGDEYFSNSDLSSWELKYTLDNDVKKYAWAAKVEIIEHVDESGEEPITTTEEIITDYGKGVIYYMKDEFNNEAPYDFKNILFDYSALGAYGYYGGEENEEEETESLMLYTFTLSSEDIITDYSVNNSNYCNNNTIKEYIDNGVYKLNFNIFINSSSDSKCYNNQLDCNCTFNTFGSNAYAIKFGCNCKSNVLNNNCYNTIFQNSCSGNTLSNSCYSNIFSNGCSNNTFGNYCYSNTFGNYCYSNTFGNYCYSNTFGNNCGGNTFGNNCYSNTFGNECYYNTFGNGCYGNTFGNYCYSNTFGYDCRYNMFGNYCQYNTFGNNCYSNTFGNYCQYNTFGNNCYSNTFGNYCQYNTFGNYCQYNTFGNECYYNTFGNYFIANTLGEYVQYVDTVDDSANSSSSVKYVKILNGTQGTYETRLHITFSKLGSNDKYCQYAGINSSGELRVWCFADMFE